MRLSDAEWTVMAALWEESPRTARDVHSAVSGDTDWSYSTVRTLLGRLAEKDAVRFPRLGRMDVPIYFLRVEIGILSNEESFEQCINRICTPSAETSARRFF